MSSIGLPLLPGTLPSPTCYPATPQEFYNLMFSLGAAQMNGLAGILVQSGIPDASFRDYGWIKLSGVVPVGLFAWNSALSYWVWPNLAAASGYDRRLYAGDLTSLQTYDGGDTGIIGDVTGPMWTEDTDFQGRSPIGVGAIPGTNPARSITLLSNAGEGDHTITIPELPAHSHIIKRNGLNLNDADLSPPQCAASNYAAGAHVDQNSENTGSGTPANVVHPVRGLYVIKRTARIFYRGN